MAQVSFNIRLRGIPDEPDNFELLVSSPGLEDSRNVVSRSGVEGFISSLRSRQRVVAMEGLRVAGLVPVQRARIAEYLEMVLEH